MTHSAEKQVKKLGPQLPLRRETKQEVPIVPVTSLIPKFNMDGLITSNVGLHRGSAAKEGVGMLSDFMYRTVRAIGRSDTAFGPETNELRIWLKQLQGQVIV